MALPILIHSRFSSLSRELLPLLSFDNSLSQFDSFLEATDSFHSPISITLPYIHILLYDFPPSYKLYMVHYCIYACIYKYVHTYVGICSGSIVVSYASSSFCFSTFNLYSSAHFLRISDIYQHSKWYYLLHMYSMYVYISKYVLMYECKRLLNIISQCFMV